MCIRFALLGCCRPNLQHVPSSTAARETLTRARSAGDISGISRYSRTPLRLSPTRPLAQSSLLQQRLPPAPRHTQKTQCGATPDSFWHLKCMRFTPPQCVPPSERYREFDINNAEKLHPNREAWLYVFRLSLQQYCCKKSLTFHP